MPVSEGSDSSAQRGRGIPDRVIRAFEMGPQHLFAGLPRQLSVDPEPPAGNGIRDVEQLEHGAEIVGLNHQLLTVALPRRDAARERPRPSVMRVDLGRPPFPAVPQQIGGDLAQLAVRAEQQAADAGIDRQRRRRVGGDRRRRRRSPAAGSPASFSRAAHREPRHGCRHASRRRRGARPCRRDRCRRASGGGCRSARSPLPSAAKRPLSTACRPGACASTRRIRANLSLLEVEDDPRRAGIPRPFFPAGLRQAPARRSRRSSRDVGLAPLPGIRGSVRRISVIARSHRARPGR